ncbi:hypothetical protein PanWU01x14_001840 [Parasponia andersonii]|uniref:Uncharacterized protein n=1 Tax=Parasponia andersonii TaxID=3476 RepID=A0A2P5E509_PARAD|nr:hypothetical protein PanWU01x14_001840 [Parasponia andersonii]
MANLSFFLLIIVTFVRSHLGTSTAHLKLVPSSSTWNNIEISLHSWNWRLCQTMVRGEMAVAKRRLEKEDATLPIIANGWLYWLPHRT